MENAVPPPSEQRSPAYRHIVPQRPQKTPIRSTPSAPMSSLRLVGQAGQELNSLLEDELVSSLDRIGADPCESAALAPTDDTSQRTDKLPVVAQDAGSARVSRDREGFTQARVLDGNPAVPLSKNMQGDESGLSLAPEDEYLSLPVYASANVRESQEYQPAVSSLPPHFVNEDCHPDRIFGDEDAELVQWIPPGTVVQQEWRSSTHFPVSDPVSWLIDREKEDTWRIPAVGNNTTRQPLYKSLWSWLKRFPR